MASPIAAAYLSALKDPRPSIAERYGSERDFLERTTAAAAGLQQRRLLLTEDVPAIIARARRAFRALTWDRGDGACGFLGGWRTQ